MNKTPAVYMLTNKYHGTIYIGFTTNITTRIYQHKYKMSRGFSSKYNPNKLIYFELHKSIYSAITREKQLKNWKRQWKIELIEQTNPSWNDLYHEII